MSSMTNIEIANTILSQLGGGSRKIAIMTGANQFMALESGVQFKFPQRVASKGNCVRIVLDADDTYTVTFFAKRGVTVKEIKTVKEVYCDQLQSIFEAQTGLYLSL